MNKIIIHSSKREAGSNINNGKFKFDYPIKGDYKFIGFTVNNSLYNVNQYNNIIYYDLSGVPTTATLTLGNYSYSQLATEIGTQTGFTVTFNVNTGKFTFTNGVVFKFTFGTNTTNSANILLGMNKVDGSDALSHTSDNMADIYPYKEFYITIDEDNNKHITGNNHFNVSLLIQDRNTTFGSILHDTNLENYNQVIKIQNTKQITYRIVDRDGNLIDFNGNNWTLYLEKI